MSPTSRRRPAATGPSSRRARLRARASRISATGDAVAPILTRALTKRYGDLVAVDSLDLEISAGEIFGLLGQNGAGKTTTILMLLGLTEPTSGKARVVGLDPARHPLSVKRRVGYLPDSVGFYGGLTGRENLRYTARLNGLAGHESEARIDEVLGQVGMVDRADTKAETYSRGMLQRLGIADALVKDPEILILDEPTAAIDPIGVVEILDLLRQLADEERITILLSSHLLSQVQSTCDRVGIFAAGRLIGVGTVPELSQRFGEPTARIEVSLDDVDVPGAGERAKTILANVPGVTAVQAPERGRVPWVLLAAPDEASTVRVAVLAAAAREGLQLTGIRPVEPSLDDIYRSALHATGLAGNGRVAA